ncbi:baseplate J/gp47 family protein [Veillonella montpellierensis]|uniref:baseplate J/gp47 family protein n=1 Tax=Veillonella montpellierensis TaxID=187328 RepID=UPI0023F7E8BB|nr:baseplate J/gp47 family protein [Veillonella montpellierensis]
MLEPQSRQDVLGRLLADFKKIDKEGLTTHEGSFVFDTLSSNAVEFEKSYAEMQLILDAAFPQTSWGEYLTRHAESHGVFRKNATQANVLLTVTGTANAVVPKGSEFGTDANEIFRTTVEINLGETGTGKVLAVSDKKGKSLNVGANTITKIVSDIYEISTVNNEAAAYDGYDEETDAELLDRLLLKVRQPATSGNVYHYEQWAKLVNGVLLVKVIPLWNGPGTVKVIVINNKRESASTELIEKVKAVIAENAPIGATVTVVTPTIFDITVELTVTKGIADIEAIKKALNEEFKKQIFNGTYVSYANIGKAILANQETGVLDYRDLKVNNDVINIDITHEQLPTVKEVIVHGE